MSATNTTVMESASAATASNLTAVLDVSATAASPVQFNLPSGLSPTAITSAAALAVVGGLVMLGIHIYKRSTPNAERASKAATIATLIVIYSLCSSSLLIINKVAVTFVPAPSFILFAQLLTSAVFVKALAQGGAVEAEPFRWDKAQKYVTVVVVFTGFLYCNVKALQYVPVDTIICFRASIPLVVAVVEFACLGRELPSLRSWVSLIGVLLGAVAYTYNDIFFNPQGYFWVAAWYVLCIIDAVIMKHVADSVPMTTWTRTYYTNAMAAPLVIPMALVSGEATVLAASTISSAGAAVILVSCGVGLAMNYFSWKLREAVSATTVTVIGNICKFITILANILIWDQHSSAHGTVALIFCLAVGCLYQQAGKRPAGKGPADLSAGSSAAAKKDIGEAASDDAAINLQQPLLLKGGAEDMEAGSGGGAKPSPLRRERSSPDTAL